MQTNINFTELVKLISDDTKINKPSAILADYGTTIADLSLWSKYNTEVAVNDNQADILQSRFDVLLSQQKTLKKSEATFKILSSTTLKQYRSLSIQVIAHLRNFVQY